MNGARSNLERGIDVSLHGETVSTVKGNLYAKKLFVFCIARNEYAFCLIATAMSAENERSGKEFIAKAQWCLDTLRNKYWSEMALVDRVYCYMFSSDLEYRRSNYTEAEEFARLAKDKAVEMSLDMEASQTQKRLDFLSVITRGKHNRPMVRSKVKVKERMPT